MKIIVISGSYRKNSQSHKVANWILERSKTTIAEVEVKPVDIKWLDMALDPEEFWAGKSEAAKDMKKIYDSFEDVDGFVIVTPEWGGGIPPALRQFILMSGTSFSHKPVLAVGVSATPVGGIRPIEELKHASKNTRFVLIPDPVVIPQVETVFNKLEVDPSNEHEKYTADRLDYSLKVLEQYVKALSEVRTSGVINYKEFPFGM
jgi:azobenzene reductase